MDFLENIVVNFDNAIVLLDIDGTIVEDEGMQIKRAVIEKVEEMKNKNQVYMCSNMRSPKRRKVFENLLAIQSINPKIMKPSKKIVEDLAGNQKKVVVIGDKVLIDGVFAKRIGARFIKVRRKTDSNDPWGTKIVYILDDIVYKMFYL